MNPKSAPAISKLKCDQCSFENEVQRVYCHNCGAKLDRSSLPVKDPQEPARKAKIASAKLKNQQVASELAAWVKWGISIPIAAALVASLISIFKPSRDLDEIPPEAKMDAPMIGMELMELSESAVPRKLVYTSDQIDAYLFRQVKPSLNKVGGVLETGLIQVRGGVEDGVGWVIMVRSVGGLPVHTMAKFKVITKNGKVETVNSGGKLGSLSMNPKLFALVEPYLFAPLWKVFDKEFKEAAKLQAIQTEQDKIVMIGGPPFRLPGSPPAAPIAP